MKHAIILAHPSPTSFNASVARAYAATLHAMGHEAAIRDLYAMDFDPRLKASELPWAPNFAPGPDVVAERGAIGDAEALAFVYPFWFNAPPAIIKGYVERVFGMGFGYQSGDAGTRPLLAGKSLVSITTSGAPDAWVGQSGALSRVRVGFDDHLAGVLGVSVVEHLHFGGVTPGIRKDAVDEMLNEVKAMAARLFRRPGA
jgi:NAD(P)H dehydrogenase (quinone)